MPPFETIYIDTMVAACDGGGGALGHPRVFLNLSTAGEIECPYCSRHYVNKARRGNGAVEPGDEAAGVRGGPAPGADADGGRTSSAGPAEP